MWFKRVNKRNLISTIVLIAVMLVVSIFSGGSNQLPRILNLIFIYSIAALALNVVCGCLGEFVLGHGGFLLVGYTCAVLITQSLSGLLTRSAGKLYMGNILMYVNLGKELHPLGYVFIIVVVILAALITGVIGFVVGLIALGRLKGDYLAIVTLGIGLIFVNICDNTPALGGDSNIGITTLMQSNTSLNLLFLVLVIILILSFMNSKVGRNILACRDDNIAAEACGVPVNKTKVTAFTFASFLAGISGALFAFIQTQKPSEFGQDLSITFLIIIVLGGLGSLTGSIIGSIVIILYENWLSKQAWIPAIMAEKPQIVYGIVLVIIMLFRSNGILGKNEFSWNWFYDSIKKIWNKIFKKKQIKEGDK